MHFSASPIRLLVVVWLMISILLPICRAQESQNPLTLHGGSILAMAGRDCVAVAVDRRFAQGSSLVHVAPRRVQTLGPHQLLACTGLEGDIQTLQATVAAEVSGSLQTTMMLAAHGSTKINKNKLSTKLVASLVSHLLYKRRNAPYYVEPIIAGLDAVGAEETLPQDAADDLSQQVESTGDSSSEEGSMGEGNPAVSPSNAPHVGRSTKRRGQRIYRPYLCSLDCIGARSESRSWCCSGTAALFGAAQAGWRPNLSSEELMRVMAKVFLSALERDSLSGYGVVIYLLTPEGITEVTLSGRND